jgi:hypothetical protein
MFDDADTKQSFLYLGSGEFIADNAGIVYSLLTLTVKSVVDIVPKKWAD